MINQKNKQVILNMAANLGAALATMLFFFVLSPYFRGQLGDVAFGAWLFLGSLMAYFSLLNTGLGAGLIKYIAEFTALNDKEKNLRLINTAFFLYLVSSVVAVVLSIVLYYTIGLFPKLSDVDSSTRFQLVVLIFTLTFSISLPFTVFQNILRGLQRYDICNVLILSKTFVTGVANVLAIYWGYGLLGFVLSTSIVSLIFNFIFAIVTHRHYPFNLSLKFFDRQMTRRLYSFSFFTFIGSIAAVLIHSTDNLVITGFLGLEFVTIYGLGFRLLDAVQLFIRQLMQVLMPVASEYSVLSEIQRREKILELFIRGSRFCAIIYLPPLLFLTVFGQEFIRAWQGENYEHVRETYIVFLILTIPNIFALSQMVAGTILTGIAHLRIPTLSYISNAVLNLILSVILVQYWGIYGVAAGTVIPMILARFFMNWYYRRAFHMSLFYYFRQVWSRLAPLAAVFVGGLFLQRYLFHPERMSAILLIAFINGSVFWLVSYYTLDSYERFVLRAIFARLTGKSSSQAMKLPG